MTRYFNAIPYDQLKEGDLVQFFGVHVLGWTRECHGEPTMAFIQAEEDEVVILTPEEYNSMKKDVEFLEALRAAGVDNWSGYDMAFEFLE